VDTRINVHRPYKLSIRTLLFVLLVSLGISAQPAQGQLNAELGIKAGRTFTTVSGMRLSSESDRRTGWTLAGTARIPLAHRFILQSSAAYVQKGARRRQSTSNGSTTVTMQVNYIEFPLMVGARWPMGADIAGRVLVGPAVGFNMSAEQTADHSLSDMPALRDQMRRTEVSAMLGAGLDIDINYQTIMVDARYHRGLTALLDASAGDSLQNQGVSVTLGVVF
jgi:hypothetical protein